jgi:TetR/AcrR family transcriptional regulator, regulator of autoinduction and epiphytic fitness
LARERDFQFACANIFSKDTPVKEGPTMTSGGDLHVIDGRRARGQRTRLRVIEALLELVSEGVVRPTAQEIAARAGVALRTVYHHFEDVEALRRLALDLDMQRHFEILTPIDASLSLDVRIVKLAQQCRELFEAVTPIRRATLFDQHSSPDMAKGVTNATRARSEHVARVFEPEFARFGTEDRAIVDTVNLMTSWVSWEYIRTMLHRSASEAEQTLIGALRALFSSGPQAASAPVGANDDFATSR